MKIERLSIALGLINLVLLIHVVAGPRSTSAQGAASVLRGSALEILDNQGRVRASMKVQSAERFKPTGDEYPETVILRLIDPNGRPEVKIVASEKGGALSFVGDSDATQVLLQADRSDSSLKRARKGSSS